MKSSGNALATMSARFAEWDEDRVGELIAAADRLAELADEDGPAFAPLLDAWQLPSDEPDRDARVEEAVRSACAVPLQVCRIGSRLAEIAQELFDSGKPDLRGDAATALYLADAAVASGAHTVRLNAAPDRSRDLVQEAHELAERTASRAQQVRPSA